MNRKLYIPELQESLSAYPEGSIGEAEEHEAIERLFLIGERIGYGRLQQLAGQIQDIQLDINPKQIADKYKVHYDRLRNQ